MKVILLEDVKKQGKKGQVIEVAEGYGRNYLIKNNLAKVADQAAMNSLKAKRKAEAKLEAEELAEAKEIKEKIEAEDTIVEIKAKIGEDGRFLETIPSKQIAEELEAQYNISVDKRKIQLGDNLSALGHYNVDVRLNPEVTAKIRVNVVEA